MLKFVKYLSIYSLLLILQNSFIILFCSPTAVTIADTANQSLDLNPDEEFIRQSAEVRYFYEPMPISNGNSVLQIGASFTILPIPLVENEYPTPAIDIQYKRGLIYNLSFMGNISTNFFTNLIHLGLQWNNSIGNFSFGLAQHFGTFFGFIEIEGQFENNSAHALFYLPVLRLGYRFDEMSFSLSFASSYIFNAESQVSGLNAIGIKKSWNDYFCTIALEQPFLKKQLFVFGFSLNYSKTPYQSWLMYNTSEEYKYLPEFFFAFHL